MSCLQQLKKIFFKSSSTKTWKNNYIPKDATQQDIFLSKYPSYDGRGIKIAIIDSGFDVSLDGFQQTSENLPKIIDCFDFTGNGDVDISEIRKAENNNILIGLSGRKLKIPKKWINPSGKWHLGLKTLYKPTMSKMDSDICQKLPEIDCIVWFDGRKWCACIETFDGNLEKAKVLTNFRDQYEYGILRMEGLEIAYCIAVYDDGNLLEIFTPHDEHGSVVAQIAAAHFPENPEKDGLASGAQLILMSIWGPEKETDEQFLQALNKALLKCIELKVDIINCSFRSYFGDEKIAKLINEMVNLHNILFFKSAGNYGPFYATVLKCDSCVENLVFRIGAILTPEIKKRIYGCQLMENHPPIIYDLSSRGPGAMGSQGLDFVAPGAAITDNPRFFSEKIGGFAGTSFSSANAAGAVACLLSGLKANSIQYSPKSIKYALFKTANLPNERNKFEFGHGIIQIYDAFEYYCKSKNIDFNDKIQSQLPSAGGIFFMQNDDEKDTVMERKIDLSKFIEIQPGKAVTEKWTLEISPKSAENFIQLLSTFNENNLFKIKINTKNLEAGSLNFAEILVIDPFIGSIYSIPVNVIYVLKVTETHNYRFKKEITLIFENPYYLILYPYFEENDFKKCDIKITALESPIQDLCLKYIVRGETQETIKTLDVVPKLSTQTLSFSIENKSIHEFCFYQNAGSFLSNVKINLEYNFINE